MRYVNHSRKQTPKQVDSYIKMLSKPKSFLGGAVRRYTFFDMKLFSKIRLQNPPKRKGGPKKKFHRQKKRG